MSGYKAWAGPTRHGRGIPCDGEGTLYPPTLFLVAPGVTSVTVRVDDLSPCSACNGRLFPLVLCETCGAATILRDAQALDWAAACPECGTFNPWQLICDQCHTRFPAPGVPAGPAATEPANPPPEVPPAPIGRPRRRIRGDVDTRALMDLLRILGLDPSRAQALVDRGYDALWKIARAKEEQLARIPEVGPVAARKMVASFQLLNYSPPKRTKESIAQDEYACPLCGCVTAAFPAGCVECGAKFDEEEMEEDVRQSFAGEGDAALLGFYDGRLKEKPDDSDLWYARGLVLESLGRVDDSIASLDWAASKAPEARKIRVAQLRVQARQLRKPEVAAKLRSTAKALLDDVAWEQEVAQLNELISGEELRCPHCDAVVPAEMALCPSCGARLSAPSAPPIPSREPSSTPELDTMVDDLLVGELEESLTEQELELTKAAVLDWLIEELEESMTPDTQVVRPPVVPLEETAAAAPSPLKESIGFLSGWMRGSRGLVSGLRPKRAIRGGGKVNGLVNGKGRVNGLVNGVGRTNGLVNGMGRVNGLPQAAGRVNGLTGVQGRINGITNGTPFVRPNLKGLRLPHPSRRVRYASLVSGIVVAALVAAFLIVPSPGPSSPISIDGAFGDWSSVPTFDAATVASNAAVSIARYASLLDRDSLYLFASTQGGMLADPTGYDGIDFLIDADGNASTGFAFEGIGADAVVQVFGGNHTVAGGRLFAFPVDAEVNWSRRQPTAEIQAASSVDGLEVKTSTYDIDRFDAARFRVSVYADDFLGASSRSLVFMFPVPGAILLETRGLTSILGSGATSLLEIRAHATGMPSSAIWQVSDVRLVFTPGINVSLSPESLNLTQGQPDAVMSVSVSAPGFFPGDVVEVTLVSANSSVPVFVRGDPIRAYVIAPPARIQIDGLFDDWRLRDVPDTDFRIVWNRDLDIAAYGAATSSGTAFFHVRVNDTLLGGSIPERFFKSLAGPGNGTTGGGSTILPRRTGENELLAFFDTNASDPRGVPVGGILADYLVDIRGQEGRITSEAVYVWSNRWVPMPSIPVTSEKSTTDIEASLPLPSLNGTRIVIESTDWAFEGDTTISASAPAFAPSPAWTVTSLTPPLPRVQGFGGQTLYLHESGPFGSAAECSAVKGLNTTEGSSATTVSLSSGSKVCFFTDPAASDETISAGSWAASLDLSATGSVLNVTFAVTAQDGSSPDVICWDNKTTTSTSDQPFGCSAGMVSILSNQRIRLRIEYISGTSVNLAYDGSATNQDSSLTVPIPEFGDGAFPLAAVGTIVLLLLIRRKRGSA